MQSRIRWGGLRLKILAWFLIPMAVVLTVVAFFIFYTYQRVTEELVLERNQEVAQLLASQLTADLLEHSSQLGQLTTAPEISQFDPLVQQNYLRLSVGNLMIFDGGVVVLDSSGTVVAADPRRPETVGQDWSDRTYYRQMSEYPSRILSDIVADGPQGVEVVVLSMPIQGGQGLVAGMFRLDTGAEMVDGLQRSILDLSGPLTRRGSQVYLVDGSGSVIYSSGEYRIGDSLAGQESVQRVLARETGSLRTQNLSGVEIVASYSPVGTQILSESATHPGKSLLVGQRVHSKNLPGTKEAPELGTVATSWGLVTEESWDELISTSQRYGRWLLLLLVLGGAVPALVIALGTGRITQPLAELTSAAQEVAGGNLGQVIQVRTGDELEELAQQFNGMSAQLQESYASLEQRVIDRTRELATLNELGQALTAQLDTRQVLDEAYRGASRMLDTTNFYIALYDPEGEQVSFPLWVRDGELQRPDVTRPAHRGLTGYVLRSRTTLLIEEHVDRWLEEMEIEQIGPQALSWLGVPLVVGDLVVGVMAVQSHTTPRAYDEHDRDILTGIASQAAIAIHNAQLYEHAQELATVEERQRLARDLHDAVSQTLFSASLIADVLPRIWDSKPEEGRRRLEELRQLTRGALAEMRTLLFELRPAALVETPLGDLLRQLGEATTARARIPVSLEIAEECTQPPDVQVALYRIAQEGLNNIVKHANASQIALTLRCQPGLVELSIRDDGRGFDPNNIPPDHFGLGIMHERAEAVGAILAVESEIGLGTEVAVTWESRLE
jgi:nitrate/nitrite-specific signal transduction histidine kinase